jgi:hypothetical protein
LLALIDVVCRCNGQPVHHALYQRGVRGAAQNFSTDPHQQITNSTAVVPLHAASGSMHVTVYVGQPPQAQTLIVDTGSTLSAWTCESPSTTRRIIECGECVLTTKQHHCDYNNNSCTVEQSYTEGSSWSATEVNDLVAINSGRSIEESLDWTVSFPFGCQRHATGLFVRQYTATGILGLERTELSLIHVMYEEGLLQHNAFSLCVGGSGGYMGMGGALTNRHLEPMLYAPLYKRDKTTYTVQVKQLWVGKSCVACNAKSILPLNTGKGTIFDSGTTDTFLPLALANDFEQAWFNETGLIYTKHPFRTTFEDFLKLPTIVFVLTNKITLQVPPLHYMEVASMKRWWGTREVTNRMYVDEPDGAVLGLNTQRGYDILYESSNDRLGFAKADCS